MEAHLERVAREIVEAAEHTNKWTIMASVRRQLIESVAAALAACAREAKLEAIKDTIRAFEHEYMNTGEPLSGVARGIRAMCELKFEAERAVGEKGQVKEFGG